MRARFNSISTGGLIAALCGGVLTCCFAVAGGPGPRATFSNANGTWDVTTNGNRIEIKFTPDANNVNCGKIVLSQTVKVKFDGVAVNAGDIDVHLSQMKDDTTDDKVCVDNLFCEKDPYTNGDDRGGNSGSQDSGSQTVPTFKDGPGIPDKFYPDGKKLYEAEFEICAYCADPNSPQNGNSYGCIKWKYSRTKTDPNDPNSGGAGKAEIVSTGVEAAPSTQHAAAVTKFKDNHKDPNGVLICPEEEVADGGCGNLVNGRRGPFSFHVNGDFTVESVKGDVRSGNDPPATKAPKNIVKKDDKLVACNWVQVRDPNSSITIKRAAGHKSGGRTAQYLDLAEGGVDTLQEGVCLAGDNCGVRVTDCANETTFALVEPLGSTDFESLAFYYVDVDPESGSVFVQNDPLANQPIQVVDVYNFQPPILLSPGQAMSLSYPGLLSSCVPTLGACCLGLECAVLDAPNCFAQSGTYLGDGTQCGEAPCGGAPYTPAVDGGGCDDAYGEALAVQNTQTNFGDSNLGLVGYANGSELDAGYGTFANDRLYLLLAGNLESNFNKLEVFLDTVPGGQNRLRGDNPDVDFNGLNRMGDDGSSNGLTFDPEFAAEYYVTVTGGNSPYTLYANFARLANGSDPGFGSYLGQGDARSDGALFYGNNPDGILVTLDNGNVAGVPGGTAADTGSGADVCTGIEISVPLQALQMPGPAAIRVSAFINGSGHDFVSNQVLGGLGGAPNLGEPRGVNFGAWPGPQYFGVGPAVIACPGDTNCDDHVDFGDINPFVTALLNSVFCDGTGANADVSGNGSVGFEDINPFVSLLTQNPLPIPCP